jgi:WhiB family redox-sensing transcriptional regulator
MDHLPGQSPRGRTVMTAEARTDLSRWMPRGACQAEDPELFFPIAMTGPAVRQIGLAKAICSRCEVHEPCLSYAVTTRQDGVWGGTTREERMAMPVRRR